MLSSHIADVDSRISFYSRLISGFLLLELSSRLVLAPHVIFVQILQMFILNLNFHFILLIHTFNNMN